MSDLLRALAVFGLVGANAFFVVGEYAVVTARRAALLPRAEAGSAGARAALRLMDDPVRVISTVQVGITPIGILTGAVGEPLVRDLLGEGLPAGVGFVAAFVIVTYLSVVLGELVPKALTLERSEALATLVAPAVESSRSLAGSGRSPGSHSTRSAAAPARRRRRGRRRGDPRQGRRRPADHPTRDRAVTQPLSRRRR